MKKQENVFPTKETVDYDKIYHYTTPEALDRFKFCGTNRDASIKTTKKILKQIKDKQHGDQFVPPAMVDINTMIIYDGQGRYMAYKEAFFEGLEADFKVVYADVPRDYMDLLIRKLQEGTRWQNGDYYKRAIAYGNEACKKVQDWAYNHLELCKKKGGGINYSYAEAFIYGHRKTEAVKKMTLTVTNEQLTFAEKIYDEVLKMFKLMNYKSGPFIEAMTQAWYEKRGEGKSLFNMAIHDMGMDYVYEGFYKQLQGFHTGSTSKEDWKNKFSQVITNLYNEYRGI